jgi:hypothetical protein
MSDPIEVAIQKALTDRATAFATAQGMTAAISYPNVAFTPSAAKMGTVYGKWLQASFLPAPSFSTDIGFDENQHYGVFQLSVYWGAGAGEYEPRRLAAKIVAYFRAGTVIGANGLPVTIYDTPNIASGFKDDPWWVVPVSIPFKCFAPNQ